MTLVMGTNIGFNFQIINSLIESYRVTVISSEVHAAETSKALIDTIYTKPPFLFLDQDGRQKEPPLAG